MNANLEQYCLEVCCRDNYPHLLEERRYEFSIVKNIPKSKYAMLKETIGSVGGMMRQRGGGWGFSVPPQAYNTILSWAAANDLSVHTLFDHLDRLRYGYHIPKKELGKYCFVDLPRREKWQYFDPNSRAWTFLKGMDDVDTKGVFARAGSILKCEKGGQVEYYKVSDNSGKVHQLQTKRAALNLAAQYFSEKKVYWIAHKQTWVIPTRSAGILPEDIFHGLARMRPFWDVPKGLLAFAKEDFVIVREFLKVLKIDLVECSRLIELPGDKSKIRGTPLLRLEDIESGRVNAIMSLISDLGGTVSIDKDFIHVATAKEKFRIGFVGSNDAVVHDDTLFVPVADIADAPAFQGCASSLSSRLSKKRPEVDKLLALHWDIKTDADSHFVVATFLKYLWDDKFTSDLLSSTAKFDVIHKWYEDCIVSTDFDSAQGFALHDILRKVSRTLAFV